MLANLNLKDEAARIAKDRQNTLEKLRRMAKTFIDGLIPHEEYHRQKKLMELHLESMFMPEVDSARHAGRLPINSAQT